MLTSGMYTRLSEWLANISILFIGSSLVPYLNIDRAVLFTSDFVLGLILAIGSLWLSLRLERISERRM